MEVTFNHDTRHTVVLFANPSNKALSAKSLSCFGVFGRKCSVVVALSGQLYTICQPFS